MKQRTSTRKPRRRTSIPVYKQLRYSDARALHKYEDDVIVRIICEEGGITNARDIINNNKGRLVNKQWKLIWPRLIRNERVVQTGLHHYKRNAWRMWHCREYAVIYGPLHVRRTWERDPQWEAQRTKMRVNAKFTSRRGDLSRG